MNISFNTGNNSFSLQPKRKKFGPGSLILLLISGLVFLASGLIAVNALKIDPGWTRVSGRVTGAATYANTHETMYAAIVQYTVAGQTYQVTSSVSSAAYPSIGANQEVAYNPAHPDNAKVVGDTGTTVWVYVVAAVGVIILVLTPVAFVRSLRRSSTINRLLHDGQKLQGVLTGIHRLDSFTNRPTSSPVYRLMVSATDFTGAVQTYKSDLITGGLGSLGLIDFQTHAIPIDVYINPTNPQDYYVDVSEVPNLTPDRIAQLVRSATGQPPANTFAQGESPNQSPMAPPPPPPVAPPPITPGSPPPAPPVA